MKPDKAKPRVPDDRASGNPAPPNATAQSIATILIVVHFFCILVALSGNVLRSSLQDTLIRQVLRPYLQFFNFDPDFAPFHLTRGTVEDADHRWEVLPVGQSPGDPNAWKPLPENALRWGESLKRWQRLGSLASMQATLDNEEAAAEIARGAASYALYTLKIKPQQVRCRRLHDMQTWDETSPEGLREFPYVANIVIDERGNVSAARVSERRETAQPENSTGNTTP